MTSSEDDEPRAPRVPLRLRLSDADRPHPLDGGWWPQSRDLGAELAQLVNEFPSERARIVKATYSPPDWDDAPKRVTTARGYIETTGFRQDFSPVLIVTTSDRHKLCLLVIPPDASPAEGEAALEAAVTPYFAASPSAILDQIIKHQGD
jgi:hypothetical protein